MCEVCESRARRPRGHDDAADYEHDHEKWSILARYGYKLVLATWDKVTRAPRTLLTELGAALSA